MEFTFTKALRNRLVALKYRIRAWAKIFRLIAINLKFLMNEGKYE